MAGCVLRDTRGVQLSDADRVNYFPASPLFTITVVLEGELRVAPKILSLEALRILPVAPKLLVLPPQPCPQMSWSAGPVLATTIAFFPDAWQQLGGKLDGTPPANVVDGLSTLASQPLSQAWPVVWQGLETIWAQRHCADHPPDWVGSDRLKDWTYHLMGQLVQTGAGRGLRSAQRRLQRWTGLNRQTIEFFAKVEDLHRINATDPDASPAEIAVEAGFADQSHMGRALKRATGFSPVTLNQKIATEESFWCYRLLGERF